MQSSNSRRAHKLGDQIMRILSEMLVSEIGDDKLAMVTVSGVRMSKDLSIAQVLYTAPGGFDRAAIEKRLDKAAGFLRGKMAKRLKSKYIPQLKFQYDEYLEDMVYGHGPDAD